MLGGEGLVGNIVSLCMYIIQWKHENWFLFHSIPSLLINYRRKAEHCSGWMLSCFIPVGNSLLAQLRICNYPFQNLQSDYVFFSWPGRKQGTWCSFWINLLFGPSTYRSNPSKIHVLLPCLSPLFKLYISENFHGLLLKELFHRRYITCHTSFVNI